MSAGVHPDIFQRRRGFFELRYFDKHFVKNTRKKDPKGTYLEIFLVDTLKTTYWMENVTQKWAQLGLFCPKQDTFFNFQPRTGEDSQASPSCAPASVAEYTSIPLNIPYDTWTRLNKLFWQCHGSEYSLIILYLWQTFENLSNSKYGRVLNMTLLKSELIVLTMPEFSL